MEYSVAHDRPLKKTDDILGGPDEWKNDQIFGVNCPSEDCRSDRAAVKEIQIRSGDEPMTKIYRCILCKTTWRED